MKNKKGFTLIEIIIVMMVLGIIASIAVPKFMGFTESAKMAADKSTLRNLNNSTTVYAVDLNKHKDIFKDFETDLEKLEELVDKEYIHNVPQPQGKNSKFSWLLEEQIWVIVKGDSILPQSPLGSSFEEVSKGFIDLINENYENKGSYGRDWGEYRFTDIGLTPDDWESPVSHVYYKPSGSLLRISPEEGYTLKVKDNENNTKILTHSLNWDLIYYAEDENWYYHSISDENIVDIETLEIER